MKLYHGSTVIVKHPSVQKGRKATDFGKGFYTTTNLEQAQKWALLKKNREQSEKAVVSVYEVPDNILIENFLFSGLQEPRKNGWNLWSITDEGKTWKNMTW